MAISRRAGRWWWPATKRQRVLERAEREQAHEQEAARQRLLSLAASPG
jgi:hypothetical protein